MPKPNILFLMCDQLQGRVFDPQHPCRTPNLDSLAGRGIRFTRAYTPNAVCSPARASLMTGLHVHNHGVLRVTHTTDNDQSCLRTQYPHWAQHLQNAGYNTGYFGKWHVERSMDLTAFGWDVNGCEGSVLQKEKQAAVWGGNQPQHHFSLKWDQVNPGYTTLPLYGVTDIPPEQRNMGIITSLARDFLASRRKEDQPWCCFVSVPEPHDPFITGEQAFAAYDVDNIQLNENVHDTLEGRPGIYRKASLVWKDLTDRQRREAAACYYASITEIDAQFGTLLDQLEAAGQLENTIVIITSDHGELLGAHGLYTKNFSAYEEIYNVPLIMAGPGIAQGVTSAARVGTHELCPTILDLVGAEPITVPDSSSFLAVLRDPAKESSTRSRGYSEYFGNRYHITYRVVWDRDWKYVHNGFDFDELYNLEEDPNEMRNCAEDSEFSAVLNHMAALMWQYAQETNDHSLLNTHYPILRLAPVGPLTAEESQ